jgi:DNA-directed RNA polymerase subunit K/omega
MDYKKTQAATTTETRDINSLIAPTDNIYKTIVILSKRSNQINHEIKQELDRKLEEFASYTDNLEEVFENREQIEISKFYERLPKSTLIAIDELSKEKIYFRANEENE